MIQHHHAINSMRGGGGGGGGGRDNRRGSKPGDDWQVKNERSSRGEKADRSKISGILSRRKEKGGAPVRGRRGIW